MVNCVIGVIYIYYIDILVTFIIKKKLCSKFMFSKYSKGA